MYSKYLSTSLVKMVMKLSKEISDSKTKINEYQNFFLLWLLNKEKLQMISEFVNNIKSSFGLLCVHYSLVIHKVKFESHTDFGVVCMEENFSWLVVKISADLVG